MKTGFQTVGLVARTDKRKAVKTAAALASYLEKKELQVLVETELARKLGKSGNATPVEKMRCDLVVTMGGDGTILRTCLALPKPEPPILAINMGMRGFLANTPPKEALHAVDRCLKGRYRLVEYAKIASSVDGRRLPDALNEVFISTEMPVKLLYARIWKDGVHIVDCQADGVIVASHVGSTAYSLSAGGPVLDPDLDAFVLTPVCPLNVFHPIVFSEETTLTIEVVRPKKALVVIDGHYHENVDGRQPKIVVKKSEYKSSFIVFDDDFYQRLATRLLSYG